MRHRLFIPAATALLFALTACTQDELAGDNRLPEGEYPVVIRATGLSVEATPLAACLAFGAYEKALKENGLPMAPEKYRALRRGKQTVFETDN